MSIDIRDISECFLKRCSTCDLEKNTFTVFRQSDDTAFGFYNRLKRKIFGNGEGSEWKIEYEIVGEKTTFPLKITADMYQTGLEDRRICKTCATIIDKRGLMRFELLEFDEKRGIKDTVCMDELYLDLKDTLHSHTHHPDTKNDGPELLMLKYDTEMDKGVQKIATRYVSKIPDYHLTLGPYVGTGKLTENMRLAKGEIIYGCSFINSFSDVLGSDAEKYKTILLNGDKSFDVIESVHKEKLENKRFWSSLSIAISVLGLAAVTFILNWPF